MAQPAPSKAALIQGETDCQLRIVEQQDVQLQSHDAGSERKLQRWFDFTKIERIFLLFRPRFCTAQVKPGLEMAQDSLHRECPNITFIFIRRRTQSTSLALKQRDECKTERHRRVDSRPLA
jgi:hypothetical protein